MSVFTWIQENWQDILALYAGLVAVASVITRLTPTIKDDGVLLAIVKFIAKFIALNRSTNDEELRNE